MTEYDCTTLCLTMGKPWSVKQTDFLQRLLVPCDICLFLVSVSELYIFLSAISRF